MRFYFIRIICFLLLSVGPVVLIASDGRYAVAGGFKGLVNAESMAVSIEKWLNECCVPGKVQVAQGEPGSRICLLSIAAATNYLISWVVVLMFCS